MRIDLDVVLVTWQHLAEPVEAHLPGTEVADQRFLEARAVSRHIRAALPALPRRSSLESIAALEVGMPGLHVAEPRNVDRVGTPAHLRPILRPRQLASRATTYDVVHQIVPQLATRVAKPGRKF